MNRLRYVPWLSIVAFVGLATVPSLGGFAIGLEWISQTNVDVSQPMLLGYYLGWSVGVLGLLIARRLLRIERIKQACIRGWVYLETVHWPVETESDKDS